jgi:hypothetical protein
MSKAKRLESIEQAVAERVAELKSELDTDPGELERRRKKRALQAAEERVRRVERARSRNWWNWSRKRRGGPRRIPRRKPKRANPKSRSATLRTRLWRSNGTLKQREHFTEP